MDNRAEVREFLTSRRAKVTPEQVGLPEGTNRRVPGLRRSEVAALAGVSIEYYTKLERAASPVARPPRRRNPKCWTPHSSLQWILDAVTSGPAFVRNGRLDILAANALGRAFYQDVYDMPGRTPNIARFTFH